MRRQSTQALAKGSGRDLAAEGVVVLPMHGATNIGASCSDTTCTDATCDWLAQFRSHILEGM